jgi:hypothetical protein
MINNLKDYQAVHIVATGKYLVHLPAGTYFFGSGDPVEIRGYSGQTLTVENPYEIRVGTTRPKSVLFMKDSKGNRVEVKEYNDFRESIKQYETEFGTYHYPDLETEFEVRRKLDYYENLDKIFDNPATVLNPVSQIELVGELSDTGSEFIQSSFEFGQNGFWHGASPYRVNIALVAKDEFKQLQALSDKLTNSDHSGLRYAKFENSYIFNDRDVGLCPAINIDADKYMSASRLFADLESAHAYEKLTRNYIREKIKVYINKDKGLEEITAFEVLQGLEKIYAEVASFKLMKTSKGSKSHAIGIINDLITKVKKNG